MTGKYIELSGGFTIIAKVNDDGLVECDEATFKEILCRFISGKLSNNESINLWYDYIIDD